MIDPKMTADNEGFRRFVYQCTADKNTIGYGFNLDDVGLSKEESAVILQMRLNDLETELAGRIDGFINLSPIRKQVLCDMAYQLGVHGLLEFKKTITYIEAGQHQSAASEMLDSAWARQTPERAQRNSDLYRNG